MVTLVAFGTSIKGGQLLTSTIATLAQCLTGSSVTTVNNMRFFIYFSKSKNYQTSDTFLFLTLRTHSQEAYSRYKLINVIPHGCMHENGIYLDHEDLLGL